MRFFSEISHASCRRSSETNISYSCKLNRLLFGLIINSFEEKKFGSVGSSVCYLTSEKLILVPCKSPMQKKSVPCKKVVADNF